MKVPRLAVVCVSTAILTLIACSDDDTVVALNVNSAADVGEVGRLNVKFTQGTTEFVVDIEEPPHVDVDGAGGSDAVRITGTFYERITLPDSFETGNTRIDVEAFDASGASTLLATPVFVRVREGAATAAFVALDRPDPEPEPEPMPEGGAGGMPGEAGAGGMPAEGGAGGMPGEAGAGGMPAEGGAGGMGADAGAGGNGGSTI